MINKPFYRSEVQRRANSGFSLVEVVLAIGIISFCLVALLGMLVATGQSARDSRDRTENSLLFQKIVGQLKMKPFAQAQEAQNDTPEIFPLPSLKLEGSETFDPFVVDEQQRYVGLASDATARSKGSRIVRVMVRDAAEMKVLEMPEPSESREGQLAFVRVEISTPAAGYRETETEKSSPNKLIYETEISPQEQ